MYKNGNYEKILNLIKDEPISQSEIRERLGKRISIQGVSKHLKRLVDKREVAYFGNKVNKLHTKILLRKYYGLEGWPLNAHQVYIHTPESGKLYRKLIGRYKKKNKDLIDEITKLYRVLEVMTKFQGMYAPKGTKLKRDINKIYKRRDEIVGFESSNEGFKEFIKIIKMSSIMFVVAYKEEKTRNEITMPMFNKLRDLFIRIKDDQENRN